MPDPEEKLHRDLSPFGNEDFYPPAHLPHLPRQENGFLLPTDQTPTETITATTVIKDRVAGVIPGPLTRTLGYASGRREKATGSLRASRSQPDPAGGQVQYKLRQLICPPSASQRQYSRRVHWRPPCESGSRGQGVQGKGVYKDVELFYGQPDGSIIMFDPEIGSQMNWSRA